MADDAENWLKIQKVVETNQAKSTEVITALAAAFAELTAAHIALVQRVQYLEATAQKRGKVVSLPGGKA